MIKLFHSINQPSSESNTISIIDKKEIIINKFKMTDNLITSIITTVQYFYMTEGIIIVTRKAVLDLIHMKNVCLYTFTTWFIYIIQEGIQSYNLAEYITKNICMKHSLIATDNIIPNYKSTIIRDKYIKTLTYIHIYSKEIFTNFK